MIAKLPRINAALALLLALFYVAWWMSLGAPTSTLAVSVLLLATGPWLIVLRALWRANRFGTTLAGFLVMLHFAYAVMELVANPAARGWIAIQTFLSLLLLTSVMASLKQVRVGTE